MHYLRWAPCQRTRDTSWHLPFPISALNILIFRVDQVAVSSVLFTHLLETPTRRTVHSFPSTSLALLDSRLRVQMADEQSKWTGNQMEVYNHAKLCRVGAYCPRPGCKEMTKTFPHMDQCRDRQCTVISCLTANSVVAEVWANFVNIYKSQSAPDKL